MEKYKDLHKGFERELDEFFKARAGRGATIEELRALRSAYKREHLPLGADAVVMARASKLLRPRPEDVEKGLYKLDDDLKKAMIAGRVARLTGYFGNTFSIRSRGRNTWADVLTIDPAAVKRSFTIPADADPVQTVVLLCEALLRRSFNHDFDDALLERRLEAHAVQVRERGYKAVFEVAGKKGVSLSDLETTAEKALSPAPNATEIDIWHERYDAALQAGADEDDAARIADNAVRAVQRTGIDL